MTYRGPDGQQYVAVLSGIGGWSGLVVAGDLATDDPTAAFGAIGAFADLEKIRRRAGCSTCLRSTGHRSRWRRNSILPFRHFSGAE